MSPMEQNGPHLLQSNSILSVLFRESGALLQGMRRHGQSKANCENRRVLHVDKSFIKERGVVKLNESGIRLQVSLAKTRENDA